MFLSALDEAAQKARGFEAGANDYVTKPFEVLEVQARVKSLLKAKAYADAVKEKLASELRIAREIQMGILPEDISAASSGSGLEAHSHLEPAREVGGDLFEVLRTDDFKWSSPWETSRARGSRRPSSWRSLTSRPTTRPSGAADADRTIERSRSQAREAAAPRSAPRPAASRDHDGVGEVIERTVKLGAAQIYRTLIDRDRLGRVRKVLETIGTTPRTLELSYDAAGNVAGFALDGSLVTACSYDPNGNRIGAAGPAFWTSCGATWATIRHPTTSPSSPSAGCRESAFMRRQKNESMRFAARAVEIEPFLVMEIMERAQELERAGRSIIHPSSTSRSASRTSTLPPRSSPPAPKRSAAARRTTRTPSASPSCARPSRGATRIDTASKCTRSRSS